MYKFIITSPRKETVRKVLLSEKAKGRNKGCPYSGLPLVFCCLNPLGLPWNLWSSRVVMVLRDVTRVEMSRVRAFEKVRNANTEA